MARRILYAVIIIAAGVAIYFVLQGNKTKLDAAKEEIRERPSAIAVKTAKADIETVRRPVSLIGTVNANRDVMLVAEIAGQITQVYAKPGDNVSVGATLIKVEDDLPKANFAVAEANLKKARKDLERYRALRAQNATTDAMVDNAVLAVEQSEANHVLAKQQLDRTAIKVPFSGVFTSRSVDVGSYLAPGTPIGNLVDLSQVKVIANVPEEDVFKLKIGDPVTVSSSIYANRKFNARVYTIGQKADEAHTYPVEVIMSNAGRLFKAGMFARVEFVSISAFNALVIPREALISSLKNPRVYVVVNGKAVSREISVGQELENKLTVVGGLQKGDVVVTGGQINLTEGVAVSVVKQ